MGIRQSIYSVHAETLDTQGLRSGFLVEKVPVADRCTMVYSHIDRIIAGGVMSVTKTASVGGEVGKQLGVNYSLERRELGVTNIGDVGMITVNGQCYEIGYRDVLYVGKSAKEVVSASIDTAIPVEFYYNCVSTHTTYPTRKVTPSEISPVTLGDSLAGNRRTINKYSVLDVLETCQLNMGLMELAPGNLWNTIPCHTHERRTKVYFYLNMNDNTYVFHMIGQPQETRYIVMHNKQVVISPSWSIHSGIGTKACTLIWGMVGESQVFGDMGHVAVRDLRQS